jgi:hypothetical protein
MGSKSCAFILIEIITILCVNSLVVGFANASTPVYDIFDLQHGHTSPTIIQLGESVSIYAQVSFVQSGVGVQDVNFTWYVNGTQVFTENATSSTLNYTPQNIGVYLVNATVNGYSNGQIVTVTVLSEPTESPTTISPTPTVPELSWLTIPPLLVAVFSVALVFRRWKQVKKV